MEARQEAWEEQLHALAGAAGIDLNGLGPWKSDPAKALLAAALKRTTSVSNRWLAERLSMGEPASVSQFARRLMLTKEGKRDVRCLLSGVKT